MIPLSETLAQDVQCAMKAGEVRAADITRVTGVSGENVSRIRYGKGQGSIGYELAGPVLEFLGLDPEEYADPDLTWTMPQDLAEEVPHERRREVEQMVRWWIRMGRQHVQ